MKTSHLLITAVSLFLLNIGAFAAKKSSTPTASYAFSLPAPPVTTAPQPSQVRNPIPGHLAYVNLIAQLDSWHKEAPNLTEINTYGNSTKGQKLIFIRVTNLLDQTPKKKVLITGCIHGNEPLATSCVMAYIGTMLSNYGIDPQVTSLLNTRDIYFVPVVSPDSFPHSRHVDGVDPNRNFPGPSNPNHQSIKPLGDLQKFFLKHQFSAAISTHTFGRVYLIPYGDSVELCPNNEDYLRLIGQMQQLSGYRRQRACEMYSRPIFGSEVDWYYRHGAFSIVMEVGTHQRIPTMQDTQFEFNKTYKAVLLFIKEAPLIKIGQGRHASNVRASLPPL